MASLSSQIARRFPQLERFSDSERLAFVRETRRGWWWAWLTRLLMPWFFGVLTALVTFAAVWRAMTWGLQAKAIDAASDVWMGLVAVSYAGAVALGFVAWSVVRRRLVWRRVREALYEGWLPGATPRPNRTPADTRARRRYVIELLAMLALSASPFVALIAAWLLICGEAGRARELKPGAAGLNKLIATLPPAGGKPGEPVWLTFSSLWKRVDDVEERVWKEMGSPYYGNGNRLSPAYADIGVDSADVSEEHRAEFVLEQQMAERMLPALKAAGVFDSARAIIGNSNVDAGVPPLANDQAVELLPRPGVRDTFNALRFNIGRMAAAIRSKDLDEFTEAFRVFSGAARVFEREPFFLSRSRAVTMDAIAVDMVRRALVSNPPPDERWLERMDVLLAEAASRVPFTYSLEADRLGQVDIICYAFYRPEGIAAKRLELSYNSFKDGDSQRLGTLRENLKIVNDRYDWFVKEIGTPRIRRPKPPSAVKELVFHAYGADAVSSLLRSAERLELDRCGAGVVCAVERFNAANGRYPATLEELVPQQLKALPIDPWSGRPFSYKLFAPGADAKGRRFLVYTWGLDNTDNGGKEGQRYYDAVVPPLQEGIDYIVNFVERS